MKFTLILGSPRSGTSLVASIVEQMGLNLGISTDNSLDGVYKTTHSFKQRKDIHFFIAGLQVSDKIYKQQIHTDLFKHNTSEVIKEPYLLFILDQIREFVLNIIFVVRNPRDTISSQSFFIENNGGPIFNLYKKWNEYNKLFIESVGDIPHTIVNYDNLLTDHTSVIGNLQMFLNLPKKHIDIPINTKTKTLMSPLPPDIMYIYKFLTEFNNNNTKYMTHIDNSPNCKCFCGSGKKYKKCCVKFMN